MTNGGRPGIAVAAIQLSFTGTLRPAARSRDTSNAQASDTASSTRAEENDGRDDRDNDRAPATRCAHDPGRVRSRHALPSLTFSV